MLAAEPLASAVILGECASLKNSRRHVPGRSKAGTAYTLCLPSKKCDDWMRSARLQLSAARPLITDPVAMLVTCYYASERPDLDESAVMDALQGRLIENDRQIREKHVFHAIDRDNPRGEIELRQIGAWRLVLSA